MEEKFVFGYVSLDADYELLHAEKTAERTEKMSEQKPTLAYILREANNSYAIGLCIKCIKWLHVHVTLDTDLSTDFAGKISNHVENQKALVRLMSYGWQVTYTNMQEFVDALKILGEAPLTLSKCSECSDILNCYVIDNKRVTVLSSD